MKKLTVILGIALLGAPLTLLAQESPYQKILEITRHEFSFEEAETEVETFVKGIYPSSDENPLDVTAALQELLGTNCSDQSIVTCTEPVRFAKEHVLREARIRTLGRDLQLIATSYEMPIHTFPDKPLSFALRAAGVQKLWQATNEPLTSPTHTSPLLAEVLPWDDMSSEVDALAQEIPEEGEEQTGIVWRYTNGFHTLETADGTCTGSMENLDGTELQYTRKRWCAVEDALRSVLERAQQEMDLDAIGDGDAIFSTEEVSDGIFVWVSKDDAGLAWEFGIEPVLPSLDCSQSTEQPRECLNGLILGGIYPPEPEDPENGAGLCSRPIAKQGYLCRAIPEESCDEETTGGTIRLSECTGAYMQDFIPIDYSESGPNVCTTGGWRQEPEKTLPDTCYACQVKAENIQCGCNAGEINTYGGGINAKADDGTLQVCVDSGSIPGAYLQLKQMVIAQKTCGLPPGTLPYPKNEDGNGDIGQCCGIEYQAALAMCNAIAQDGNFTGEYADLTVEACAAAVADASCKEAGYSQGCSEGLPSNTLTRIEAAARENVAEVGSCTRQASDPRVNAALQSLPIACNPECQAAYTNTIGNNLCYSGQCIELSWEAHRLVPGRSPYVSTEEAFPFDACIAPEKAEGDIAVNQLPPTFLSRFPDYQPRLLIESLDRAFCQANGLPALTPPVLCGFDTNRRLDIPLMEYSDVVGSLFDQPYEYSAVAEALEEIAPSVGARTGTELYTQYLQVAARSFGDMADFAARMLQEIEESEFPLMMCPRDGESCIAPEPQ